MNRDIDNPQIDWYEEQQIERHNHRQKMTLKEAYDQFLQALKDESGLSPSINIRFHGCRKENNALGIPFNFGYIPAKLAKELDLPAPSLWEADGHVWFASEDYKAGLHLTVFR